MKIITVIVLSALLVGCNSQNVGIIGGADGPTSIYVGE